MDLKNEALPGFYVAYVVRVDGMQGRIVTCMNIQMAASSFLVVNYVFVGDRYECNTVDDINAESLNKQINISIYI